MIDPPPGDLLDDHQPRLAGGVGGDHENEAALRDAAADRMVEQAQWYAHHGIDISDAVVGLRSEARSWRGTT